MMKQPGWWAPLYWERYAAYSTSWRVFALRGSYTLSTLFDYAHMPPEFFEAYAFARWRGRRLPTERNGNTPPMENRFTGTCLRMADYILLSRPAMPSTTVKR